MAPLNLPVVFGSIVAGAVIIDYGLKSTSKAFASANTGGGAVAGVVTSTGAITPGASGYVNPFAKASGVVKERVDEGWDFHTSGPGQPIVSIGDAKITNIIQGWFAGQPLIETQLLGGSHAGQYVYYAEGLTPTVSIGQSVKAGEQIATTTSQPSGLEFGFGADAAGTTLAKATTGYTEGQVTPAGLDFKKFLESIGV